MENLVAGIFLVLVVVAAIAVLAAAPVMVLWGAVADDFGIQTIGLGTAFQLSALTSLLFKSASASSSN